MQLGKLNERIQIEALVASKGRSGGVIRTWSPVTPVIQASRRSFSGNERSATSAGGEMAVSRDEFTVHWRAGISAEMRVVHEGRYYNIRHVNNFAGRRESLVLTCDTGVNNG